MQLIFDRLPQCRSGAMPPEVIGLLAPTRRRGPQYTRGIFSFPIEQYADQLLPARVIPKMHHLGQ